MKIKTCFAQKPMGHFNQILYVKFWVHRDENLVMTKPAVMLIYGKNPPNIFSGTSGPIIIRLNDGPGLTLTYFEERSNL